MDADEFGPQEPQASGMLLDFDYGNCLYRIGRQIKF